MGPYGTGHTTPPAWEASACAPGRHPWPHPRAAARSQEPHRAKWLKISGSGARPPGSESQFCPSGVVWL